MKGTIKGLQETQHAVLQAVAATRPRGGLGRAVRYATLAAHRYATQETVVDTGSWRASHRPEVTEDHGRIFLDPSAQNPNGGLPSVYGPALELTRGGRYAVYRKTVQEAGPQIVAQAGKLLEGELP